MASSHYPDTDGPSEPIRTLAGEILWELDHAGREGLARVDFPCSAWASPATFRRAIRWLRECGCEVPCEDGRYRLAAGSRRTLPAHALSRVDLLDSLRVLLGPDVDPLEAIAGLLAQGGQTWRPIADGYERQGDGVVWRLYLGRTICSLRSVDGDLVRVAHTWDRRGQTHRSALAQAEDLIENLAAAVPPRREAGAW